MTRHSHGRARTESTAGERLESAGHRAQDAYRSVRRYAERVTEEMEEVTSPHGIPTANLSEEDSLVTTIAETIAVVRIDDEK